MMMLLVAGACCLALGLIGWETSESHEPINDEAIHAHLTSLQDHHSYFKSQNKILGELIEEGAQNQVAAAAVLAGAKAAATFAAANPEVIGGVISLVKNIFWGGEAARKAADPKKLDASFNDSKVFAAEIKKRLPKSYGVVTKLRQDLKVHHFDLSNAIHEVSLLAETTKANADRTIRKLALRKKFVSEGTYKTHPEKDVKIWTFAIRRQVEDLSTSIAGCDKILTTLKKLQKDVSRVQAQLESELSHMRKTLE